MLRAIIVSIILIFSSTIAQAGEFQEWVQAFGYAVVCHESGHTMAGDDVNVPTSMSLDVGGPHYQTEFPAYQFDQQLLLQFETNKKIVDSYNSSPTKSYAAFEVAKAAYASEIQASTELNKKIQPYINEINRKAAYIAGAGFVGQQSCESKLTGSLKGKYLIVSGTFYKLGYAAFPHSLQPGVGLGDVEAFGATGSMDLARVALALSGLSDIYRGMYDPQAQWSIGFYRSTQGQPGLQFTYIF